MKVLTLTQPWATLVIVGAKRIETRSWKTPHRGVIGIHAAKGFPRWAQDLCFDEPECAAALASAGIVTPKDLPRGKLLGTARLIDCVATPAPNGALFTSVWLDELSDAELAFGDLLAGPVCVDARRHRAVRAASDGWRARLVGDRLMKRSRLKSDPAKVAEFVARGRASQSLKRSEGLGRGILKPSRRRREKTPDAWKAGVPYGCDPHHVLDKQIVRAAGGDEFDLRNRWIIPAAKHSAHTHGRLVRLPMAGVPDSAIAFAVELLGPGKSYNFFRRTYAGPDPRLDALLP